MSTEPADLTGARANQVWQTATASLEGLLGGNATMCESVASPGVGRLVATFRAKYTSCKAFCEHPDNLARIERALAEAAGGHVKLDFALVADPVESRPAAQRPVPQRQRMAKIGEHPFVRRATELFEARVVRVDEPTEPKS